MYFIPLILIIFIGLLCWSFYKKKASFWNGFLFLMTVFAFAGNVMFFSLISNSIILHFIFLAIAIAINVVLCLARHPTNLEWDYRLEKRKSLTSQSINANSWCVLVGLSTIEFSVLQKNHPKAIQFDA